MMGVQTKINVAEFVAAARDAHLLTIPAAENVARLLPPLTVSDEEITEGVRRLEKACAALEAARAPQQGATA